MARFDNGVDGSPEWYTPKYVTDFARRVMSVCHNPSIWLYRNNGVINFDPASCEQANERNVQAEKFYTEEDDSLSRNWAIDLRIGDCLWLNPPYGRWVTEKWTAKWLEEVLKWNGAVQAFLLVTSSTSTNWYHELMEKCTAMGFFNHRIQFDCPDDAEYAGNKNMTDSTLFFFGTPTHTRAFVDLFNHGEYERVYRNKPTVFEGLGRAAYLQRSSR